jgi:hypothetical protein
MKKQVIQLAQALYPNSLVEVTGGRKRHNGGKKPYFIVQVNVDGLCLTSAAEKDAKTAYKTAGIKLSKGVVT